MTADYVTVYVYDISGDMKLGDDSSAEQPLHILDSAFDFLDDQDSTCEFFGVKRHSLNLEEEEELTAKDETIRDGDESSDDEVGGRVVNKNEVVDLRTGVKSHIHSDYSDFYKASNRISHLRS